MTWEQKLEALQAISECALHMRKPGDWYVGQYRVEVADGSGILMGRYGNGRTPEEAVENHWSELTGLEPNEYIVLDAYGEDRKQLRWNGYRWADA